MHPVQVSWDGMKYDGESLVVGVGLLVSWRRDMGVAQLSCLAGCECQPKEFSTFINEAGWSMTFWRFIEVKVPLWFFGHRRMGGVGYCLFGFFCRHLQSPIGVLALHQLAPCESVGKRQKPLLTCRCAVAGFERQRKMCAASFERRQDIRGRA